MMPLIIIDNNTYINANNEMYAIKLIIEFIIKFIIK